MVGREPDPGGVEAGCRAVARREFALTTAVERYAAAYAAMAAR